VTYLQRIALPPSAVVNVDVVDASGPGQPTTALASVRAATAGRQPPFPFTLTVDSAALRAGGNYAVEASIEVSGERFFSTTRPHPVLTRGHPPTVEVVVEPVGSARAPTGDVAPIVTLAYDCADADGPYRFTARLRADSASLLLPERTVQLANVGSPPGADSAIAYSDGTTTFRWRGGTAALDLGAHSYVGCRNDRARAGWEDARLRRVDFRAVSQDGEWVLEVKSGGQLVLITDFGWQRFAVPAPPQATARATQATYGVDTGAGQITIIADRRPCRDPRSGELFDTSVTLRLKNGAFSAGCGRALP
jgi:hypothetical protein